jgi:hypothetical protein
MSNAVQKGSEMRTWSFVEFEDEFGSSRAIALRGGRNTYAEAGSHLDRFKRKHGLTITGIWETNAPTLAEAMDWVRQFTYLGRRGV